MTSLAVVSFPGSNCEHDVVEALFSVGIGAAVVSHAETSLKGVDGVVLPGGFAHGDYLRPGAIARFSPVMAEVAAMAKRGALVLGICNGFQVLTEAGLLPGALRRNTGRRFVCRTVTCRVVSSRSPLTYGCAKGQLLKLPVNHNQGNFTCDEATLKALVENDQVVLAYEENPNGSLSDIAGICNEQGNVVGLMPHPERASNELLDGLDGRMLLQALGRWASLPLAADRQAAGLAKPGLAS